MPSVRLVVKLQERNAPEVARDPRRRTADGRKRLRPSVIRNSPELVCKSESGQVRELLRFAKGTEVPAGVAIRWIVRLGRTSRVLRSPKRAFCCVFARPNRDAARARSSHASTHAERGVLPRMRPVSGASASLDTAVSTPRPAAGCHRGARRRARRVRLSSSDAAGAPAGRRPRICGPRQRASSRPLAGGVLYQGPVDLEDGGDELLP